MKIGVFGGTFDPIHLGHLIVAEEVRVKLGLAKMLFVPAGKPWLKADRAIALVTHRLEMISLAIVDNPHFKISTIEANRSGPSYTIDTIDALKQQLGTKVRLFFLLGSDALSDLKKWKEPSRLVQECQLVTFMRPSSAVPSYKSLESAIPGISRHITFVDVSQIDISATQIRDRISKREPLTGLVPAAVERYILEHGLYNK